MNTNPNAKRILFFGDSLVYGKIPAWTRYTSSERFTGKLQSLLGDDYEIIEEGLRARMLSWENAYFPYRDGAQQFGPILGSHAPVDLIVIMLGTNDMNSGSDKTDKEISEWLNNYRETITRRTKHFSLPEMPVVLICPPRIDEEYSYPIFGDRFRGTSKKIERLPALYEQVAREYDWYYIDTTSLIWPSPKDGIHLDEESNTKLGEYLAIYIKEIL